MKQKSLYLILVIVLITEVASVYAQFKVGKLYYYKSITGTTVKVASQNDSFSYWNDADKPTDAIKIPSKISCGSKNYKVTEIASNAFDECSDLTLITIPNSATSIRSRFGCKGLISINVDTGNQNYSSDDGLLFNKGETRLREYPKGKFGSYTLPLLVTTIGKSAFIRCEKLTSVTIRGVKIIGGCIWGLYRSN